MKSKKILVFILGLVVLVLAIGLVFFLLKRPKAYLSALPQDVRAVAVLNLEELSTESDINMKDLLKWMARFSPIDGGIDFTSPIYGFASKDGYLGLLAAVDDAGDLKKICEEKGLHVESQRGLKWVEWRSWLMVFDGAKALVMGPVSSSDAALLRGQMAELMKQDAHDTPLLQRLAPGQGVLSVAGSLDILPAKLTGYFIDYLPNKVRLENLGLAASLRAEGSSLYLDAEILTEGEAASEAYDALDQSLQPLRGNLVNIGPSNPFLWICAGLRGGKALDFLRRQPSLRTFLIALNMCVDADMMLRSVEGDASLVWPTLNLLNLKPLFTATLTNKDFLRNVNDWKTGLATENGVQFRVLKDNDFYLKANSLPVWFGVRNNLLYVTPNSSLASQACLSSSSTEIDALKSKIMGKVFYASLNVSSVLSSIAPFALILGASPAVYEVLDAVERLNLSATDTRHFTLELKCKKDSSQILLALFAGM